MSFGDLLTVVVALVALGLAVLKLRFVVVASPSMEPSLRVGDRLVILRRRYARRIPGRSHVVVAWDPASEAKRRLVKRIVATPGERVALVAGALRVDGAPLREPYLGSRVAEVNFGPVLVPDGCVFVLGDDRTLARDSRDFGPLPLDRIVGRAVLVVFPPARVRRL